MVGGPIETPTLTGQHQAYLANQLRLYRSGARRNDVYRRMREIAAELTDAEILPHTTGTAITVVTNQPPGD